LVIGDGGRQTLFETQAFKSALVLLDLLMSGVNGRRKLSELCNRLPPAILVSSRRLFFNIMYKSKCSLPEGTANASASVAKY